MLLKGNGVLNQKMWVESPARPLPSFGCCALDESLGLQFTARKTGILLQCVYLAFDEIVFKIYVFIDYRGKKGDGEIET